jgi:hypothetical protein
MKYLIATLLLVISADIGAETLSKRPTPQVTCTSTCYGSGAYRTCSTYCY